jgi:uncharacterized damage-inducible protein DinB
MTTARKVLFPAEGLPPEIGFYLSGMNEVREQLHEAVAGIGIADIGRRALPDTHSIGALVLHIGESEWFWMQCVLAGHQLCDEDTQTPCWDALKDPERVTSRGYSADFCLNEAQKIREQTRAVLVSFNDHDLERIFAFEWAGVTREQSMRWILHHLIDHEAQHKGQILMLKRILGLKNPGVFS